MATAPHINLSALARSLRKESRQPSATKHCRWPDPPELVAAMARYAPTRAALAQARGAYQAARAAHAESKLALIASRARHARF